MMGKHTYHQTMLDDSRNSLGEKSDDTCSSVGSMWHRWDPHIHMPGTLNSDRFVGENAIDRFVERLNNADPPIRGIGITDYYVLDSYERLLARKEAGELPHVQLLFPNIELRFAVNAGKGSPINIHLLVCPDDPKHIENTKRFLRELKFEYDGEDYGCTNDELIRLGYAFSPSADNDTHALKLGVGQSKITPRNLREAFKNSQWARDNILIAVAAGQNDGVGQMQDDGLKALREELQRMSHIIFSGRPGDRKFWCGKGAASHALLRSKYGGVKPCIHGCDAHDFETVGNPAENRICWIRGDLTFETLRQICFEPERRVYIGNEPPSGGRLSNTISMVSVSGAPWLKKPTNPINPGLVAVIGARGSGKTALVEMIAAGASSVDSSHTKRSFLKRAKEHLYGASSVLTWGDDSSTSSTLDVDGLTPEQHAPRVRYLSQQFVDQLCSSDGLAGDLVSEIERVIFSAHDPDKRLGARSFEELRDIRTHAVKRRMDKYKEALNEIGQEISVQDDLRRNLGELKRKRVAEDAATQRMKNDRKNLTPTDNKKLLERLDQVRSAAEAKSRIIANLERKKLKLEALKAEAKQFQDNDSHIQLNQLKAQYVEADLTDDQWSLFALSYEGDVDGFLDAQLIKTNNAISGHKGPSAQEISELENKVKAPAYFSESEVMAGITHSLLTKEQRRLESRIGVDEDRKRQYTQLSSRIVRAETALAQRDEEIKNAEAAPAQIQDLLARRKKAYSGLIDEIGNEAEVLKALYQPLQDRLDAQEGTLRKLTFSVNRIVDMDAWGEAGERLMDKSRAGPFKGVGTLTQILKSELGAAWQAGSPREIAQAMNTFRNKYGREFWNHAFEDAMKNRDTKKHWIDQISTWLYSTDHVQVSYGLEYEGVDIQQLSPGTRGIVLLLLYLSIDIDDDRPLVIDQPEENLDPKSIFHELVAQFKEAKTRRQIIIVTHNANLVVNTDADQVIVASRGEHKPETLPDITYVSGGLENLQIRAAVCDILEGGVEAFAERARRLRIDMDT